MPYPTWRVGVPYRAPDGWTMPQSYIAPVQSEMEGGNTRLRSKPGSNVATVEYPIMMTRAEYAEFADWLRADLNNGTSRFTTLVWLGNGYLDKTCQFAEPPVPRAVQKYVSVAVKFRVYGM